MVDIRYLMLSGKSFKALGTLQQNIIDEYLESIWEIFKGMLLYDIFYSYVTIAFINHSAFSNLYISVYRENPVFPELKEIGVLGEVNCFRASFIERLAKSALDLRHR